MDAVEIHSSNFDCDIDGGSGGPAAPNQELPTGSTTALLCDQKRSEYSLQTLLSNSPATTAYSTHPFWHPLIHP